LARKERKEGREGGKEDRGKKGRKEGRKSTGSYLENNLKQKGLGMWLKW
jgi:hypothetical protein